MTPPSVSIVVAARDAEATVGECVDSLLALRYPRELLEIVVVDNGSSDGTRSALARFATSVVLVEEATPGPAAARNAGVGRAKGDVVALIDADSTAHRDWIAELVPPLADTAVGIAGGAILAHRPANGAALFGEVIHDHRRAILGWRPPHVATGNWGARRGLFGEVGPFDETLLRSSDVEFSYRTVAAGYRLAYCPDAVVYHRNESTLTGLVREGWEHGRHGGRLVRERAALVARAKARSIETAGPEVGDLDSMPLSRYSVAFTSGRRLGRLAARAARRSARP